MNSINLYENIIFKSSIDVDSSFPLGLDKFLDEIWNKREKNKDLEELYGESSNKQAFLKITKGLDSSNAIYLQSKNYIGVIKWKGLTINLLPKVFYSKNANDITQNNDVLIPIQNHILWWLSYSKKIKFPNFKSSSSDKKGDFFEAIIYLFSKHTKEVLSSSIYQNFEDIERETKYMKGQFLVKEYIVNNFSKGRNHILNCRYNSLEIDNKFNRIIKYVCKMLLNISVVNESKRYLREVIFILDEVEDIKCTLNDCESVRFNSFFRNMQSILDYCKLFLSGSVVLNHNNKLDVFTYLIRSEELFQSFVYEFIEKEVPNFSKAMKKENYLVMETINSNGITIKENVYKINPDGFLKDNNGNYYITDTKYKDLQVDKVKQTDLYQMVSYAIRNKVNKVRIMYPCYLGDINEDYPKSFIVEDEFTYDNNSSSHKEITKIEIKNLYLPIIYKNWNDLGLYTNSIRADFTNLKNELKSYIENNLI